MILQHQSIRCQTRISVFENFPKWIPKPRIYTRTNWMEFFIFLKHSSTSDRRKSERLNYGCFFIFRHKDFHRRRPHTNVVFFCRFTTSWSTALLFGSLTLYGFNWLLNCRTCLNAPGHFSSLVGDKITEIEIF